LREITAADDGAHSPDLTSIATRAACNGSASGAGLVFIQRKTSMTATIVRAYHAASGRIR
jgi:hypothetical protein